MKKLYRIYTEHKKLPIIKSIVNRHFKGYTIIKTFGIWQGIPEKSLIIELIATARDIKKVKSISKEIKSFNNQQAVLLTTRNIKSQLI